MAGWITRFTGNSYDPPVDLEKKTLLEWKKHLRRYPWKIQEQRAICLRCFSPRKYGFEMCCLIFLGNFFCSLVVEEHALSFGCFAGLVKVSKEKRAGIPSYWVIRCHFHNMSNMS